MKEKLYICTGANYKNGYDTKYCGDIHTLSDWIELLWQGKAKDFFKGCSDAYIKKYIYDNTGKRLEKY